MPEEEDNPFLQPEIVDVRTAVSNLNKYLQSVHNPDHSITDTSGGNDDCLDDYNLISEHQIKEAFADTNSQKSVKNLVRTYSLSVLKPERRALWKAILSRMTESRGYGAFSDTIFSDEDMRFDLYTDTLKSCFGSDEMPSEEPALPSLVDHSHKATHFLTTQGKISVSRILNCYSYNAPQIQFCPQLYSIAAMLRHFMSEVDTYSMITNLVSSKKVSYVIQSKLQCEVSWRVAYQLCQKVGNKYLSFLQAESSKEELEGLFQQWMWWVLDWLPFPHVVRIFDSYLIEGDKVLFRICCALISIFTRKLQNKRSGWSMSIKKRGLQGAFIHFCRELPVSPSALFDKCFRYRNFSRSTLQKLAINVEVEIKSRNLLDSASNTSFKNNRTQSADNFRLDVPDIDAVKAMSSNLTYKQLSAIWRWLPQRVTMTTPQMAYASYNDGLSLTTFYKKSEMFEPTVLIIKTTEGDVFGAYCSTSWNERGQKDDSGRRQIYFGNGETFLFSFSNHLTRGDGPVRFPWVLGPNSSTKIDQPSLSKAELHSHQLFMAGQPDMISLGGGAGNGIYIDATLTNGKTETCKTFGNPPLCKTQDFEIAAIEVLGLARADI